MYRKVLAAVNEHLSSDVAGRYALFLAKTAKASLLICSVREPGQTDTTYELALENARKLQHWAEEFGVPAGTLFTSGPVVEQLHNIVRKEGIDIVFAATRREDVRGRFLRGRSTSRRLFAKLPCSVALVRVVHLGRIHPREILVALKKRIDRIPERSEFAAILAKAFDAKVHLFHAAQPVSTFFRGEMHLTPVEWDEHISPDLARFISHLDASGITHEKRLLPGKAGKSIALEAASRRRDLIIMGASERGLVRELIRGTPVDEVLRETPCNLIILKPGE